MDSVALITGASSGLGYGLAIRLAREGYAIAAAARREEELQRLAAEIRAFGGRVLALPTDVSDAGDVRSAVTRCEEELGPVELLVANAGISIPTEAASLSAADVEKVMQVNFFGAVYATEAVLPGMLERGTGQLVAVGSLAGYRGLPMTAAYSASKGAMHNFFESLRLDLADTGVDVTMITPGFVKSPMTDKNAGPMPFLLETDDAVNRMVRAILRRDALLAFPLPLAGLVWLAQGFPAFVYDAIAGRQDRRKKSD